MTKNEFITNLQLMLEEYAVDENADAIGLTPDEMVNDIKMFQSVDTGDEGLIMVMNDTSVFRLTVKKVQP